MAVFESVFAMELPLPHNCFLLAFLLLMMLLALKIQIQGVTYGLTFSTVPGQATPSK